MTVRWYIDEDAMAKALVFGLRSREVDVLTTFEAGMAGETDGKQLEFAVTEGRALYSFNVGDFCQLHANYLEAGRSHSGIVVVPRQRYTVGEQLKGLLALTATTTAEAMRDTLTFLHVSY